MELSVFIPHSWHHDKSYILCITVPCTLYMTSIYQKVINSQRYYPKSFYSNNTQLHTAIKMDNDISDWGLRAIQQNYNKIFWKCTHKFTKKKKKNSKILNSNFLSSCHSLPLFNTFHRFTSYQKYFTWMMFFILSISMLEFEHMISNSKIWLSPAPQNNLTRAPADLFTFKGPGNPNQMSPKTTRGCPPGFNAGTPGGWRKPPPPQTPCNSFQAKLNCPPHLFGDVHFAHKFGSSEWLLAHYSPCKGCCIIVHEAFPGMECLTIYPLNIGVNLKKNTDFLNHLQKFPWLFPYLSQNSWLSLMMCYERVLCCSLIIIIYSTVKHSSIF